ncbi:MAG: 1-(5-phosphoribosyl)-5-[(5-phosphoribosylamino)methylideneamino]imidazole-4-carboxamide isomerase [Clostridiaceae bacterium]|nr:1-(5-phosphoribosyl)-5-[(5-phosphoribosylamino)methylideneamino]imidazole-4-carboxamide isomerase [Clostridiaceae bacterium]
MIILPAIDLKGGQCVRLRKGDYATAHEVAEDAVGTAKEFLSAGARLIHMVDLDGAKSGSRANYDVVRRVIDQTSAAVELGGGIRSMEDLRFVLGLGVSRAVIGSAAVRNPHFVKEAVSIFGERIAVGIDARGGTVRTDGWMNDTGEDYIAFARKMAGYGVKTIIYTDIEKDGMLEGPNFTQLEALRQAVSCVIVASGGVSTLEDVRRLKALGIDEAIAGKAVYTGALDLAAAIREAE